MKPSILRQKLWHSICAKFKHYQGNDEKAKVRTFINNKIILFISLYLQISKAQRNVRICLKQDGSNVSSLHLLALILSAQKKVKIVVDKIIWILRAFWLVYSIQVCFHSSMKHENDERYDWLSPSCENLQFRGRNKTIHRCFVYRLSLC